MCVLNLVKFQNWICQDLTFGMSRHNISLSSQTNDCCLLLNPKSSFGMCFSRLVVLLITIIRYLICLYLRLCSDQHFFNNWTVLFLCSSGSFHCLVVMFLTWLVMHRPGLLLGLGWPLALALVFASQRPWLFVQTGDVMMTVTWPSHVINTTWTGRHPSTNCNITSATDLGRQGWGIGHSMGNPQVTQAPPAPTPAWNGHRYDPICVTSLSEYRVVSCDHYIY